MLISFFTDEQWVDERTLSDQLFFSGTRKRLLGANALESSWNRKPTPSHCKIFLDFKLQLLLSLHGGMLILFLTGKKVALWQSTALCLLCELLVACNFRVFFVSSWMMDMLVLHDQASFTYIIFFIYRLW